MGYTFVSSLALEQEPTRRQFASLRDRVDENGLLFKVRAVTNEIRDRQETLRLASE